MIKPKKFVKKPIPVEAVFLTRENLKSVERWIIDSAGLINSCMADEERGLLIITTLEGTLEARCGEHYIVRGARGEFYPVEKEIFEETYREMVPEKEVFFYTRMLKHLARVYMYVVYLVEFHSDVLEEHGVNILQLLKNTVEHDRSKFGEPQLSAYIELVNHYYRKAGGSVKDYPLNKVLSTNATIHHIISEPHHPEYWDRGFVTDKGKFNINDRDGLPTKPVDGTSMPLECVVEMVCDWEATADEKCDSVREWADNAVNKRWRFTEEQTKLIYSIIEIFEQR